MPIDNNNSWSVWEGRFKSCINTKNGFIPELPKSVGLMVMRNLSPTTENRCISPNCDGSLRQLPFTMSNDTEENTRVSLKCDYCGGQFAWVKEIGRFFWNGTSVMPFRG